MSSLSENRRWINISSVEQRIKNASNGSYIGVPPGEFIEGGRWAAELRGVPFFRETTEHLPQKQFYKLIQDEQDVALLTHMLALEQSTQNRETTVKFLENRIRMLHKQVMATV